MKWDWETYVELYTLVDDISALENGWYDTHNLEGIREDLENIQNRISELSDLLPVKGSSIGDYKWDYDNNCLVYLLSVPDSIK